MYSKPHSNFFKPEELRALSRMTNRLSEFVEEHDVNEHLEAIDKDLYQAYDLARLINEYFDTGMTDGEFENAYKLIINDPN
jgi:hypothetical protein